MAPGLQDIIGFPKGAFPENGNLEKSNLAVLPRRAGEASLNASIQMA
jgi:hypothetical protein